MKGHKNYTNWLPGLQRAGRCRRTWSCARAWTNTIGRPSYEQNVPFRIFEIEESTRRAVCYEGSMELGNADLDPLESVNCDPRSSGTSSRLACCRRASSTRTSTTRSSRACEHRGRRISRVASTRARDRAAAEWGLGRHLRHRIQLPAAVHEAAGIVPRPRRVGSATPRRTASRPSFDQPRRCRSSCSRITSATSSLFYELEGLELRLAYAYRSEYLDTLGKTRPRTSMSTRTASSTSRRVTPSLRDIGLRPVAEHHRRAAALLQRGRRAWPSNEFYGWNVLVGVSLKF